MAKESQSHSKFAAFIANFPDDIMSLVHGIDAFVAETKVAVKSLGVEYIESKKALVVTLGYRDDQPGYPIKLIPIKLGKMDLVPEVINKAMGAAAAGIENVICHEFYVEEDGTFIMVLLTAR